MGARHSYESAQRFELRLNNGYRVRSVHGVGQANSSSTVFECAGNPFRVEARCRGAFVSASSPTAKDP
jgi:hypothetical protein